MQILQLWFEILLANIPGLLIAGLLLWVMEKTNKYDEAAKASPLDASIYGGFRLLAWAVLIAAMLK